MVDDCNINERKNSVAKKYDYDVGTCGGFN